MKAVYYEVRVEGGLHDQVLTLQHARRLQRKFQAEGWNVQIIKFVNTIAGLMGVEL